MSDEQVEGFTRLLPETDRTTPIVAPPLGGLLVIDILSRAPIVIRIHVHRAKPGQLVLMTADVDRARRSLLAPLPHATH